MSILVVSSPTFQQAMRVISNITNDYPASVTTTTNHQYITGMIVRVNMPLGYGMQEINQLYSSIVVTGDTTFTIDIDTTYFSVYSNPASFPFTSQYPQVTPIGEINSILSSATRNVLPYSS